MSITNVQKNCFKHHHWSISHNDTGLYYVYQIFNGTVSKNKHSWLFFIFGLDLAELLEFEVGKQWFPSLQLVSKECLLSASGGQIWDVWYKISTEEHFVTCYPLFYIRSIYEYVQYCTSCFSVNNCTVLYTVFEWDDLLVYRAQVNTGTVLNTIANAKRVFQTWYSLWISWHFR